MIHLHATRKLFEYLPLNEENRLPPTAHSQWLFEQPILDINPLSNWHGHLIVLQRRNCLLLVHDATRFPVVLPTLHKKDCTELNAHIADAFLNTLLKCGADEKQIQAAQTYLRPIQVDTKVNRSVQGTLNQMKRDIEHLLWFENVKIAELSGYSLGQWLADRPCSVKGQGHLWPQQAMLTLLSRMAGPVA
ncbi:DUF6933 domain-containing protein [Candidatus Symbiopectobacterium sp. NZEC135]|uniref:DUF6933 domain-containing protein n=1 Tax=Candidatus Symbiopectobacterium sp. NZEC135 TaxID=2820471 RepID=UPI0022277CD1|nr:hypothetical protein [Candidatus Symbiopectobacterium sp. NZEC135]MCW2478602.1 hypothetical protein [Candidatus Symbiopectobacterium sp. NZEC135]